MSEATVAELTQSNAIAEVARASLTLGEAEEVFRQAVAGMERAIHGAAVAGVPLGVVKQRALANETLHALARGQVLALIADEGKRGELEAAAVAEAVRL